MNSLLNSQSSSQKQLELGMARAGSYAEWYEQAQQHDMQSGAAQWRETTQSTLYDYAAIQARHDSLQQGLAEKSSAELLYSLNEGVHGNRGGMGRPHLYGRAK